MLKKISNWTFGSIFRTIGRFLAYILIGILISTFLLKKDYVKADSYYKAWDTVWYDNENLTQQWSSGTTFVYKTFQATQYYNSNLSLYKNYSSNKINMDDIKGGHITIPFVLEIPLLNKQTGHVETTCTQWYENPNGTFTCTQTTATNTLYNDYYIPIQLELNVFARYTSGYIDVCEIDYSKNYISCPVINSTGLKFDGITYAIKVYADGQTSNYRFGLGLKINGWSVDGKNIQDAIENQTNQTISIMENAYNGEVNGTGENGTITDEDAMSRSCGIICKLKHLIKMFSIDNLKYLIIPTEEQMNDLFEQMQDKITSKLGILGLPVTVYTRLMQIAMQYNENQQNWCIQWEGIQVPNFEDHYIIQQGQWCYSDILQNEKINNFRTICMSLIGGLILLSFIQYLFNCLHRILDVPIQDNYEYFTTEDVYGIDTNTGEVQSHQIKTRTTTRRVKD